MVRLILCITKPNAPDSTRHKVQGKNAFYLFLKYFISPSVCKNSYGRTDLISFYTLLLLNYFERLNAFIMVYIYP